MLLADREGVRGDAARAFGAAMFELSGGAGVAGQRWGLLWGASLQEDESEAHRLFAEEIGRASCRERVCQYVYISVVAGSLKKQTHQRHQLTNYHHAVIHTHVTDTKKK